MVTIKINKEEWQKCNKASKNYWSNKKKGFFGRGIINTKKDPAKVTRIGLLGELALAKYLGLPLEFEYVERGEKADLEWQGNSIDIKTASYNYGASLIRCVSRKGNAVLNLKKMCDIYVAAYLNKEKMSGSAEICLMGWLPSDKIVELPIVDARVGQHKNWELEFGKLNPMEDLKGGVYA